MNRLLRCAVIAVILPVSVLAGTIGGDYVGGGTLQNFDRATGYFFTPTVNVVVTSLGYYDYSDLGLADRHEVGIFLADGTAVVNTFISAGTSSTFVAGTVAGTRFESVTPTQLIAGTQYYIIADNNTTDYYGYGTGSVVFAPQITWNGYGDSSTNSIYGSVANLGGVSGDLGPNLMYDEQGVPEPSTFALAIVGMGLVLAFRRRHRA
jgi:hypothetical protein